MKNQCLSFIRIMLALISWSTVDIAGVHRTGNKEWSERELRKHHQEMLDLMRSVAGYHVLPGGAETVYLPYHVRIPTITLPRSADAGGQPPRVGSRSFIGDMISAVSKTTGKVLDGTKQLIHGDISAGVTTALKGITGGITDAINSVAKTFKQTTMTIGRVVVVSPLRGLERTVQGTGALVNMVGSTLAKTLSALPGARFGSGVNAVTFDNHSVFSLTSALTAIVNPVKNSVFSIVNQTKRIVSAAEAMAIYQSARVIATMLGPIIKTLGFECIKLPKQYVEVNQVIINSVEMNGGKVCGMANIIAQNNVTITKDDEAYLVVRIPLTLKNTGVHIYNVTIQGMFGPLLDNANLEIIVDDFQFFGDVKFRRWSILKFVTIHMRVSELSGFRLEFKSNEEKSSTMSILESMSSIFQEMLKNQINTAFEKMEADLSENLLGSEL